MEAPRPRWSPYVRFPIYLAAGFAVAAGLAAWFQPHYLPLCNRITTTPGAECTPVSLRAMVGMFVIGLGVISLVFVPVVSAFVNLMRHGHTWETPRGTETALTNLPILAGFIYLATGALVAIGGY